MNRNEVKRLMITIVSIKFRHVSQQPTTPKRLLFALRLVPADRGSLVCVAYGAR